MKKDIIFKHCNTLLKIGKKFVHEGDIIEYTYEDKWEEGGKGSCKAIVSFENGMFVCRQIGFDYMKEQSLTLYDWLSGGNCKIVGNIYEK